MREVTVKRSALTEKVQANRDQHRAAFEEAQRVYREQMVEELDRMLADAKAGKKIKRGFILPEPEDHTDDYDRVLAMLAMSVDDEIDLDAASFNQYVLDQWGWQRSFASNTLAYVTRDAR